eukprot:g5241.t1
MQKYVIATANRLAADEKKRLHQTGNLIETQEEFAAFHKSFMEKLAAQMAADVDTTTASSLGEHAIPDEVARKVSEFLKDSDGVLPSILPANVVALPRELLRELWDREIKKRRMEWRKEGKKLVAAEIQRAAELGERSVHVAKGRYVARSTDPITIVGLAPFLDKWGAAFPKPKTPSFLLRGELSSGEKGNGFPFEEYWSLVASFKAAGYNTQQGHGQGGLRIRWGFTGHDASADECSFLSLETLNTILYSTFSDGEREIQLLDECWKSRFRTGYSPWSTGWLFSGTKNQDAGRSGSGAAELAWQRQFRVAEAPRWIRVLDEEELDFYSPDSSSCSGAESESSAGEALDQQFEVTGEDSSDLRSNSKEAEGCDGWDSAVGPDGAGSEDGADINGTGRGETSANITDASEIGFVTAAKIRRIFEPIVREEEEIRKRAGGWKRRSCSEKMERGFTAAADRFRVVVTLPPVYAFDGVRADLSPQSLNEANFLLQFLSDCLHCWACNFFFDLEWIVRDGACGDRGVAYGFEEPDFVALRGQYERSVLIVLRTLLQHFGGGVDSGRHLGELSGDRALLEHFLLAFTTLARQKLVACYAVTAGDYEATLLRVLISQLVAANWFLVHLCWQGLQHVLTHDLWFVGGVSFAQDWVVLFLENAQRRVGQAAAGARRTVEAGVTRSGRQLQEVFHSRFPLLSAFCGKCAGLFCGGRVRRGGLLMLHPSGLFFHDNNHSFSAETPAPPPGDNYKPRSHQNRVETVLDTAFEWFWFFPVEWVTFAPYFVMDWFVAPVLVTVITLVLLLREACAIQIDEVLENFAYLLPATVARAMVQLKAAILQKEPPQAGACPRDVKTAETLQAVEEVGSEATRTSSPDYETPAFLRFLNRVASSKLRWGGTKIRRILQIAEKIALLSPSLDVIPLVVLALINGDREPPAAIAPYLWRQVPRRFLRSTRFPQTYFDEMYANFADFAERIVCELAAAKERVPASHLLEEHMNHDHHDHHLHKEVDQHVGHTFDLVPRVRKSRYSASCALRVLEHRGGPGLIVIPPVAMLAGGEVNVRARLVLRNVLADCLWGEGGPRLTWAAHNLARIGMRVNMPGTRLEAERYRIAIGFGEGEDEEVLGGEEGAGGDGEEEAGSDTSGESVSGDGTDEDETEGSGSSDSEEEDHEDIRDSDDDPADGVLSEDVGEEDQGSDGGFWDTGVGRGRAPSSGASQNGVEGSVTEEEETPDESATEEAHAEAADSELQPPFEASNALSTRYQSDHDPVEPTAAAKARFVFGRRLREPPSLEEYFRWRMRHAIPDEFSLALPRRGLELPYRRKLLNFMEEIGEKFDARFRARLDRFDADICHRFDIKVKGRVLKTT